MQRTFLASVLFIASIASAQSAPVPAPNPAPAPAPAPPPIISKDWQVDTAACIASTSATLNMTTFRLEVAVDKLKSRPVELRIVPSAQVVPATLGIKFALDKKTTYAFAPIAPEAGATANSFWNIPRGTKDFLSYLKRENKLAVSLLDGTAAVPLALAFSLRGSSASLDKLQKNCNANLDLTDDGFERAFLPTIVATVDPTKLKVTDTASLRDLVAAALLAFKSSADSQVQLNAISKQYLKQIAEFEKLRSNLDKLTNDTVVKLNLRRQQSQASIDKANVEIPQFKDMIRQQEADLANANAAVDAATADLAPLLPTLNQYRAVVNRADNDLSTAQSNLNSANDYEAQARARLQQVINGIAQSQSEIISIQNEINRQKWDLQNAQGEADSRRRDYSGAQADRQRFDRNGEARDRESRDSRLSSIESDLRNTEDQLRQAQQRAGDADRRRQQAEANLQACRNQVAPPGPGGQPPLPPNCSSQQAQRDAADNDARSSDNDRQTLESRTSDLRNQADRYRGDIQRDVDSQYNDLVNREQQAQNRYNDAQSTANDLTNKINRLISIDLPQAQSSLNTWQSAQFGAETDVNTATSSVARAQRDVSRADDALARAQSSLSAWKQSSGYNAKKAVLNSTQQKVDDIKTTLQHLDENIASREKLIRVETKNLAVIANDMQTALNTIAQKEARSADVAKILAPYFQQRDAINKTKVAADQTFKNSQTSFAADLPQ